MIYCISDIHGMYDLYIELLKKINLQDNDVLFVLGDVVDRGPEPMKILLDMMERDNVIPFLGNHDYMALICLQLYMNQEEDPFFDEWKENDGQTTFDTFIQLSKEDQIHVIEYLKTFRLYAKIKVQENTFILMHGGIGNFDVHKALDEYTLSDLIFTRPNYHQEYYPDQYLVTGHTPTPLIDEDCKSGTIYQKYHHIAIDCAACFGYHLGAICLDTLKTYYVG